MRSHKLGKDGEAFALDFLSAQGYKILETNYRVKMGEIDVIADDKGTVVFIEVKARTEGGWDAFEAVHRGKQRKIVRVAESYLVEKFGRVDVRSRFDVLAVHAGPDGTLTGDLLKNAFMAG
ncbi:MAG: YraN family protein [Candidatus Omnitrophica bacterium]|nr:YraN family protein [Candidatus Omnitrophota bacterium]